MIGKTLFMGIAALLLSSSQGFLGPVPSRPHGMSLYAERINTQIQLDSPKVRWKRMEEYSLIRLMQMVTRSASS